MRQGEWLDWEPGRVQLGARTEPVSFPVTARTSHTTVRSPACQAAWFG